MFCSRMFLGIQRIHNGVSETADPQLRIVECFLLSVTERGRTTVSLV